MKMISAGSPPVLGIGALLFRPQGMKVAPAQGNDDMIVETGEFFTDAFWTAKVGGGSKKLTSSQQRQLTSQQIAEFRRRYGALGRKSKNSELLLCTNGSGEIMGCLGVEVDTVKKSGGSGPRTTGPLMSNVAVGRKFRRRGIAEALVKQAELLVRKQWGYTEMFLYVEKQNVPAIRLYKKMGYRTIWEDDLAQTLVPLDSGIIASKPTIIVCMKKDLMRPSLFGPFK